MSRFPAFTWQLILIDPAGKLYKQEQTISASEDAFISPIKRLKTGMQEGVFILRKLDRDGTDEGKRLARIGKLHVGIDLIRQYAAEVGRDPLLGSALDELEEYASGQCEGAG